MPHTTPTATPPAPHTRSRYRWPLLLFAVFALAFAVRLGMTAAFVGLTAPPDANANIDQVDFELLAHRLATGQGFTLDDGTPTARRAPGAPLTFAPAYLPNPFTPDRSFLLLRLWIITLSASTCVLTALIARRLAPPRYATLAGTLAGLGLALYPGHAYYAMHMLSEAPFAAWLALALYLSLQAQWSPATAVKPITAWAFTAAAAVAWAMVILTKPQFILLLPLAAVLLAGPPLWRALRHRPLWIAGSPTPRIAAACLAVSLLILPWGVRNHQQLGVTGLSSIVGLGLWGGNNELILDDPVWRGRWLKISEVERRLDHPLPPGEAAANQEAKRRALAFMRSHAADMPALTAAKLGRLLTPFPRTSNPAVRWAEALAWITLCPLLLLGLAQLWRTQRHTLFILLAPVLVTLGTTAVFFGIVRYRNALAPILLVLGGLGLARLLQTLTARLTAHADPPTALHLPAPHSQRHAA